MNFSKIINIFCLLSWSFCSLSHEGSEKPQKPKRHDDVFEFGKSPSTNQNNSNVIFEYGDFKVTMQLRNSYDEKILKQTKEMQNDVVEFEVPAKIAAVDIEAEEIFDALEKCSDKNVDFIEVSAIDNLSFKESKHLNYYLQKAKHDIQEIVYDENGEYIGVQSYEDAKKIKNVIADLNNEFNEWKRETKLIKKDIDLEKSKENNYSESPYSSDLKILINSNLFTQYYLGVLKLCEHGNFEKAKTVRDKFKNIRDNIEQKERKKLNLNHPAERHFAELDYIISKYELLETLKTSPDNGLKILQYYEDRYVGRWRGEDAVKRVHYDNLAKLFYTKYNEFKASSITSLTVNDPILAQNIINQLSKMPQTLAADTQLLKQEKEYWDEFKSEPRYEARLKSWQESIQKQKFTTQNYELTPEASHLFQELGLDDKAFTKCYGNQFQQAIHKEFVDVANKAGFMLSQSAQEDVKDLAKEIATFSDLGSSYLKAGFALKAAYTADFCWALLDCGIAITEGTIQGLKNAGEHLAHPIETATKLGQAIFDAGYYLSQVLGTLLDDIYVSITDPSECATRFDQRVERTMALVQAIENKLKNMPPRDIAKKSAEIITEGWFEAKLLSIFGKFCSSAGKKFYENMQKMASAEKVAAMTAEGLPIPFQIAEEITNNLMQKTSSTAKTLETIQNGFKVAIEGIDEILPEVAILDANKIHHILKPKHAWNRLVHNEKDWDTISRIISKVLREGVEEADGTVGRISRLKIGEELVEVTFRRFEDNSIKLGNAWINTILKKT